MHDSTTTIISAAKRLFSGTALSRTFGLMREMVMAWVFGCSIEVAGFWMAYRFAHLFRRILGEGPLQASFIPRFEAERIKSDKKGAELFRDLKLHLTLLLLLIILVGEGALWGLIRLVELSPESTQVINLVRIMLPSLLFISLYGVNAALLQCTRNYFIAAAAPVAFNCVWIAAALFWVPGGGQDGVTKLAIAVVAACAAQWIVTLPLTLPFLWRHLRGNSWKIWVPPSDALTQLRGALLVTLMGVGAAQINSALDVLFARAADLKGPAYLAYAIRLQQVPLALFGISLTGALLPSLSRALKQGKPEKYREFLQRALDLSTTFLLPITVATVLLALPAVNLIYGRGEFGTEGVHQAALCLIAYAGAILPATLVLILGSGCFARDNYKGPRNCALLAIGVNVVLNTLFVFLFHWGAFSIALATSFSAVVNAIALKRVVTREEQLPRGSGFLRTLGASAVAAVAMCIVSRGLLGMELVGYWIGGSEQILPRDLLRQGVELFVPATIFFAVFAIMYAGARSRVFD